MAINGSKTFRRRDKMPPGRLKTRRCRDLHKYGKNQRISTFLGGGKVVLSRSRRPQDGAKTDRDGAQTDQDGAKTRQVGTKTPRDDAKTARDGGRTGQLGPRRKTGRENDPKMIQNGSKTPKMAPRCSEDVSKTHQNGSCWKLRWASAASERAQRAKRAERSGWTR